MITQEIQFRKGTLTKSVNEMSALERKEWQEKCVKNAREYLFSIGQPLVYSREDGHVVAEYNNGRIDIIR